MVLICGTRVAVMDGGRAMDGALITEGKEEEMVDYRKPTPAARVRELVTKLGMSQREVARELEISDRMMRYYCSGEHEPTKVVLLALEHLVCLRGQVTEKR